MVFKRIEMTGFKSFADKKVIEFENGVTAIVGPNGCGKSNVADAVRWVLGEQSSKVLRGSNMQDVIFKGTQNRKSLSYCEVSLVFDNSDKTFNIEYDEVVFTRKLYRSGNSEYLINKNTCRLRDIVELLHDSGLGKDGYSIVAQGQVTEIVSSKPEDRRGVFEEASGIAKFKARKTDAERKLDNTRDNLVRLNDILSEVEKQVGPLKKQSENAKQYYELRDTLKILEANVYINRYENTFDSKERISNIINGLDEEIVLRQRDSEQITVRYNKCMDELQLSDINLKKLNERVLDLSLSIQKYSSDNTITQQKIEFVKSQIIENTRTISECKAEFVNNENTIKISNEKLVNFKIEKEKLDKNVTALTSKYLTIVNELTRNEDDSEIENEKMIDAWEKLTTIKANLSGMNSELNSLKEIISKNNQKMNEIKTQISESEAKITAIMGADSGIDGKLLRIEGEISSIKEQNADLDLKIKIGNRDFNEAKINRQVSFNRRNIIKEMQVEFEGYAGSVKRLLSDKDSIVDSKVIGVIAQLIKVPAEYQTAIEMALGNALQNIVTKNEDDARQLVNYLKEKRYGRVTFLPLTSIKPRKIGNEYLSLLKQEGVVGIASELIEFDASLKPVFSGLLGGTIITQNLESAISISRKSGYSFKIATLEGDIINPAGSITGGSKRADTNNLLGREKEIERLTSEIETLDEFLLNKQKEIEKLVTTRNENEQNFDKLNIQLNTIKIENASVFEKRQSFLDTIEILRKNYNELELANNQYGDRIVEIESKIASVDELENEVSKVKNSANENSKNRSAIFESLRQQKENYNSEVNDLKVKIVTYENQSNFLGEEIQRLNNANIQMNKKISLCEETINELESSIRKLVGQSNVNQSHTYEEQQKGLENSRLQIKELENDKKIKQTQMLELENERSVINENLNNLNKKRMTQEIALQKIDADLDIMKQRMEEEYQLDYEKCQDFRMNDFNLKEATSNIASIKKDISQLGSINPNAIEEYQSICSRYEDMVVKIGDLNKAEAELTQIIRDLSGEMLVRFNDRFEKINNNFGKIFSELFGGGTAKLVLVDNEDPLQAGVEILAEPPGKKLQSISLFSGGEKSLIAIAILFAILKLRPMPFCLLDEIEAALDDANVKRFATYLKRFSQETQFIVITHRKPTMELADRLYGVTMEELGVSKIVSVKLSEAVKNVMDN